MDSSIFVHDGQSGPVKEREGVELDETESTVGDKDDVSPRLQNADRIADDNGDKPKDVRKPEPGVHLTTSVVDDHNHEGVGCQTAESIRPDPSRYGTWATVSPEVFRE